MSKDVANRFASRLERFAFLAAREGVSLRPLAFPRPLHRFRQLPAEKQEDICGSFESYLAECQNALAVGGTLRDSSFQVFWNVLRRFDLRPCSDLFDLLDSNDVIEVYRYDFIQIYRNLRFLELCTYSLDEVFSYEWPELFHRKQEINFELFDLTREILSGAKKTTLKINQDTHPVEEVFSDQKRRFQVRHNFISPLFARDGSVPAFVFSLTARLEQ